MKISEFDLLVPEDRIALHPLPERDASRMLVVDRSGSTVADAAFRDLPRRLSPGDLLVLNDTRVFPARILGRRSSGGKVEILLFESFNGQGRRWRALVRSSKKLKQGEDVEVGQERIRIAALESEGRCVVELPEGAGAETFLESAGRTPLPPYIDSRRPVEPSDRTRYQTVFAEHSGSSAAPTAGLHFTEDMLESLQSAGIEVRFLTLHVGPGTFLPVRTERVEEHRMHGERYRIPKGTIEAVRRRKQGGQGRVVACGTTTVRTLETWAITGEFEGTTELFIFPGFEFRIVEAMLTNLHLPRSTLLMMVCAFGGMELVRRAYARALDLGYRFYSYGDCMLLL